MLHLLLYFAHLVQIIAPYHSLILRSLRHDTQSTRRPQESSRVRPQTQKPAANRSHYASRAGVQRASTETADLSHAHVIAMQQQLGNRAVSQFLQRKLTVGPADDAHEREADRV